MHCVLKVAGSPRWVSCGKKSPLSIQTEALQSSRSALAWTELRCSLCNESNNAIY